MWGAFFQPRDYVAIVPEIIVALFGCGILMLDFMLEKRHRYVDAVLALIGLLFAGIRLEWSWTGFPGGLPYAGYEGRFTLDHFAIFLKFIILIATALVVLISSRYLEIERAHFGE